VPIVNLDPLVRITLPLTRPIRAMITASMEGPAETMRRAVCPVAGSIPGELARAQLVETGPEAEGMMCAARREVLRRAVGVAAGR
jgi:hypothetical protein